MKFLNNYFCLSQLYIFVPFTAKSYNEKELRSISIIKSESKYEKKC